MSFSAKSFLKTYGTVGVSVYGGITAVSIGSIYLALRLGGADTVITTPLERILGDDSDIVRKIKQQLGEANQQQQQQSPSAISSSAVPGEERDEFSNPSTSVDGINFVREGTYLGIASIVDSLILPVKLAVCLPVAKLILKRRGR
jgi:hypothetical protein